MPELSPAGKAAKEAAQAADLLHRMADEIEQDANILRSMVRVLRLTVDEHQTLERIVKRLDALSEEMCALEEAADAPSSPPFDLKAWMKRGSELLAGEPEITVPEGMEADLAAKIREIAFQAANAALLAAMEAVTNTQTGVISTEIIKRARARIDAISADEIADDVLRETR